MSRRLCVAADAAGYSTGSDLDQAATQRGLVEVLDGAADAAGMHRTAWHRQPAGDGEFAVLPSDQPESVLVDRFLRELEAELFRYNAPRKEHARLRLRLAIHFGRLSQAANGFAGPAPIVVTRLVNSTVLREALRLCPEANLAVLLSTQVFDDTVATLMTTLRPADLRKVHVSDAKFADDAWLLVPGVDTHAIALEASAGTPGGETPGSRTGQPASPQPAVPARPDVPAGPTTSASTVFNGPVTASGNPVFGIQTGGSR